MVDAEQAMKLIRSRRGLTSQLTREIGLSRGAISQWRVVPADKLVDVERISGIPRHILRPDLVPPPGYELPPELAGAA
jgi:DNA-binding transcriptional regulator YdaS (Cro superfamily)